VPGRKNGGQQPGELLASLMSQGDMMGEVLSGSGEADPICFLLGIVKALGVPIGSVDV
jgi:hypothetical protein